MSSDAAWPSLRQVDTAVIGNGPSALILSFILSGHTPHYNGHHDDQHLHDYLQQRKDLLHLDPSIFDHIRSSLKYSSQALPINVILDTLQRPDRDVSDAPGSCIEWKRDPSRAVDHVVLGEAARPGGQWTDSPVATTWNIGTLSYAEQLSLPGYSFADYWQKAHGEALPEFVRPARTEVANYYAAYPKAVGIDGNICTSTRVGGVSRSANGFHIASHNISCRRLVLATGTFSINLPPPTSLRSLPSNSSSQGDVLVVGSGFTAADLIISTPPGRKIIHVYNWNPENRPSPLQGCHSQAYPEYAWIYRQMRMAAVKQGQDSSKVRSSRPKTVSALPYFNERDWANAYEGFANAGIMGSGHSADGEQTVSIRLPNTERPEYRRVSALQYATGRRGSLSYLSGPLQQEVLVAGAAAQQSTDPDPWNGPADSRPASQASPRGSMDAINELFQADRAIVSGATFRPKIEDSGKMELAKDVYVIGSLTGDSLVRFALGGCCDTAGRIVDAIGVEQSAKDASSVARRENGSSSDAAPEAVTSSAGSPSVKANPSLRSKRARWKCVETSCTAS